MPHSDDLDERLAVGRRGLVDLGEVEALGFDPLGGTHARYHSVRGAPRCQIAARALWTSTTRARAGAPRERRRPVRIRPVAPRDRIEAVMFDMDGTLLDSWDALLGAYHDATTEVLGAPLPTEREDIDRLIQLSARDAFPELAGGDLAARRAHPGGVRGELPLAQRADRALRRRRGDAARRCAGAASSSGSPRRSRACASTPTSSRPASASCSTRRSAATRSRSPSPTRRRSVAIMELLGVEPGAALYVGDGANDVHGRAARPACRRWGRATASTRRRAARRGPSTGSTQPLELPAIVAATARRGLSRAVRPRAARRARCRLTWPACSARAWAA